MLGCYPNISQPSQPAAEDGGAFGSALAALGRVHQHGGGPLAVLAIATKQSSFRPLSSHASSMMACTRRCGKKQTLAQKLEEGPAREFCSGSSILNMHACSGHRPHRSVAGRQNTPSDRA